MIEYLSQLLQELQPGGWIVAGIFFVAVIGWVQGLWWLTRRWLLDQNDLARLQILLEEWSEDPLEQAAPEQLPTPLRRSLASHKTTENLRRETVRTGLIREVGAEDKQLKSGLWFVGVSAFILPLLGLFGTLIGIIQAFDVMTLFGAGRIELLSDGVSTALISTQAGLLLALPMLFLYRYLKSRLRRHLNALRLLIRSMMRYPDVVRALRYRANPDSTANQFLSTEAD